MSGVEALTTVVVVANPPDPSASVVTVMVVPSACVMVVEVEAIKEGTEGIYKLRALLQQLQLAMALRPTKPAPTYKGVGEPMGKKRRRGLRTLSPLEGSSGPPS